MEEKSSLTKEEINKLIKKIGSGDNAAWETLVNLRGGMNIADPQIEEKATEVIRKWIQF